MNPPKVRLGLLAHVEAGTQLASGDRVYPAAMLRPGVYVPGGGMGAGLRVHVTREFIERRAGTMKGKPVNLDHGFTARDEVGVVRSAGNDGGVLRGELLVQKVRPRFGDAVAFVDGRLEAGAVPEVSVELDQQVFRHATPSELPQFDLELVDAVFSGVAILPRGACGAKDGCGIGLAQHQEHVTVLSLFQGQDLTGAQSMANGDPDNGNGAGGGTTKCSACLTLQQEGAAARKTLQAKLDETNTALSQAREQLKAYVEAEVTALKEALQAALPNRDLKEIVGETPSPSVLRSALAAAQAAVPTKKGKAPAASRFTAEVEPEGSEELQDEEQDSENEGEGTTPETYYAATRQRLGLSAETRKKLPTVMRRNEGEVV